jgi:LssY C-terminus
MPCAQRQALWVYALLVLLPHGLWGQGIPSAQTNLVIQRGTPVKLQLSQTISSAHARKYDRLEFVVVQDVIVQGLLVIPAGTRADGSVVKVRGKRPLGMGGNVTIRLDSVDLTSGERLGLFGSRQFKGRSHTVRMGIGIAITAAFYLPAAPVFLLARGGDSTVLKGSEITAYTQADTTVVARDLPAGREAPSQLDEMVKLLPPRATNGEGREGDMLNLIFMAQEDELERTFAKAGWVIVERSKPKIFWHLLWQRTNYTKLPMDRLFVFGRAQDYSYALPDPNSIVARRHHLRIWKTDRAVNGVPLWVGAATHDVSIQFVKRKFRLFHKIDPNVDAEREFIAGNLAETRHITREEYVHGAAPVFAAQTATGQDYHSDSRLLLLELNQTDSSKPGTSEVAAKLQ